MRTMIITDGSALSKLYNVVYRSLEFASRSVFTDWQNMVNIKKWETLYGGFEHTDFTPYRIALPNESGGYAGEIVKWAKELNPKPDRALLSGESNEVKLRLSFLGNVVHTAGLFNADSVDFVWNFEEDPPSNMGKYSLIISQAMIEHLLNPYKHLSDLSNLLDEGGHLIIHGAGAGFVYHRFPIDACRFYPDWFEESAKRLGLRVLKKANKNYRLFYMMEKMEKMEKTEKTEKETWAR